MPCIITEIKVHMNCDGCETKIRKAIQKLHGVDDIDIDMEMQKVTVMGWADQRKVLKAVRKTGRRAELWPYPYNPESYSFNRRQHETETFTNYANKPASSYNYNTHGYSEEEFGYYQKPAYAAIVDEEASAIFSDENPHACSVM
ncbi:heavy metal-associated isoprenylated plant protein [Salix suchowensis]|nr:heavy metal-associated isoprenylated plant protein [Salix suchowensis]